MVSDDAKRSRAFAENAFDRVVVRRGESLRDVASRTGTRAEVILLLNPHASASALSAGMVLDVPQRERSSERGRGKVTSASGRGASGGDAARGVGVGGANGTRRERDAKAGSESDKAAWHSFSGQLYENSYPTLERKSQELHAEVMKKVEEFGAGALVGELVGKSGAQLSAWRLRMMSAVTDTATNLSSATRKAKAEPTKPAMQASSVKKDTSADKENKVRNEKAAAREKERKEKAAEREREQREKAVARKKEQSEKAAAREKERSDKEVAREKAQKEKVAAAEKRKSSAMKRVQRRSVDETTKEIAWTLIFTAGLGLLGHALKTLGEKYHIGEENGDGVKEWHPKMIWDWMRTRLVVVPCRGGGLCLTVRGSEDAPMKPMYKVGSSRNYIASTNFAQHAAPVEKAVAKRVEKTKAQVQTIIEGMKIRSIDELTQNLFALEERVSKGDFENAEERVKVQEKIKECKQRLAEAQSLLTIWVDQSANEAYEKNLKRKVLAAWLELLSERYARLRIMNKVYLRWQHLELSQAFNQWYENAHASKVERLRKEGLQIQEKLRLERQRMEEKRVSRAESKMKWGQPGNLEDVKRSAFEERLAAASHDTLVQ